MTEPREATALAKAVADQAHGGYAHGDNDPTATVALAARFGIDGVIHDHEPRRSLTAEQRAAGVPRAPGCGLYGCVQVGEHRHDGAVPEVVRGEGIDHPCCHAWLDTGRVHSAVCPTWGVSSAPAAGTLAVVGDQQEES